MTIPFLGVTGLPTNADVRRWQAPRVERDHGQRSSRRRSRTPNFKGFADFSSGGPRTGDSHLKPDVTAPGVSIVSTGSGTGNGAATISGTSMASPHAAGVAALTRQAHPRKSCKSVRWQVREWKAAIINTADPAGVLGYRTSRGGSGLVQPALSTKTQASRVRREGARRLAQLRLRGAQGGLLEDADAEDPEPRAALRDVQRLRGAAELAPRTRSRSTRRRSSCTARATHFVDVTLNVPAATAGASNGAGLSFQEVAGLIEVTPQGSEFNSGIKLRVPYYLVPRALSDIRTKLGSKLKPSNPTSTANVSNEDGVIAGDADFYAWGLSDGKDAGKVSNDVRAIGVQSFPFGPRRSQFIGFSVNTYDRWSNASTNEFDIFVDVNNDGIDDYVVVGVDQGAVQTGTFNGRLGSFVFSTRSPGASINFFAQAPTDSAAANIFVLSTQLCRGDNPATPAVDPEPCLNAANPRFTYSAVSFDLTEGGVLDEVEGSAKYNAWSPAISTGGFQTVAPGGTAQETISVNAAEWALTPALGLMVTTVDNKSKNGGEAQTIPVDFK